MWALADFQFRDLVTPWTNDQARGKVTRLIAQFPPVQVLNMLTLSDISLKFRNFSNIIVIYIKIIGNTNYTGTSSYL